ncbi:transporter suffix domain-containing protein [Saccharicrinis sp. FJH54]|uniref:transporter suffix domain-containing protein n=1 Tax=Saccharicrinis sp. FJH54 TaxID=3344665 RepID=UPI0035D4CD0E
MKLPLKKSQQIKLGVILILLSGVAFAIMLLIPFLDLENKTKVIGSTTALITMEVLFYVGGFLLGKELFKKYKDKLNPVNWFKRKSK